MASQDQQQQQPKAQGPKRKREEEDEKDQTTQVADKKAKAEARNIHSGFQVLIDTKMRSRKFSSALVRGTIFSKTKPNAAERLQKVNEKLEKEFPILSSLVTHRPSGFFSELLCDQVMVELNALFTDQDTKFKQEPFTIFKKTYISPRFTSSFGDAGTSYHYAGVNQVAQPWPPKLKEMRDQVQRVCTHPINYALVNVYRDGKDHIGWHADSERDMIPLSTIASVSLGASRDFEFESADKSSKAKIALRHGHLLLMDEHTQDIYKHRVPKAKATDQAKTKLRINITFRALGASAPKPPPPHRGELV